MTKYFKSRFCREDIQTDALSTKKFARFDSSQPPPFDLAAASKLRLLHRSVPPPPAGLAGVGRGGEPDLWVEISIKVVFSKD
jgi:hypothetical protein